MNRTAAFGNSGNTKKEEAPGVEGGKGSRKTSGATAVELTGEVTTVGGGQLVVQGQAVTINAGPRVEGAPLAPR